MTHSFPTRRSSELAGAVEMNVTRICDFLRPTITADGVTGRYVEVHAARSLEPDLQDRDAGLPLCLVHPWEEMAAANRYDNYVSQSVAEHFAVITVCKIDDLVRKSTRLNSSH